MRRRPSNARLAVPAFESLESRQFLSVSPMLNSPVSPRAVFPAQTVTPAQANSSAPNLIARYLGRLATTASGGFIPIARPNVVLEITNQNNLGQVTGILRVAGISSSSVSGTLTNNRFTMLGTPATTTTTTAGGLTTTNTVTGTATFVGQITNNGATVTGSLYYFDTGSFVRGTISMRRIAFLPIPTTGTTTTTLPVPPSPGAGAGGATVFGGGPGAGAAGTIGTVPTIPGTTITFGTGTGTGTTTSGVLGLSGLRLF